MNRFFCQLRQLTMISFLVGLIAVGPPAWAGSLQVNPVNLEVLADRPVTSLTLTNSGDGPVVMRVVTYAWTQENGADVYTATPNVIVSPPIFTVAPGASQLIRVGLTKGHTGEAYRVVLEEIPRDAPQENAVQVALRLDLPLFVVAANGQATLGWQAWRDAAGALSLEASNSGTRHQQVLAISAVEADRDLVLSRKMGVILPASARRWDAGNRPTLAAGSVLTLKVRTPAGEALQPVVVQQR